MSDLKGKSSSELADVDGSSDHGTTDAEWTKKEEKAAVRKLDLFLMPILVAGFFILQLDRSNISNALTDTITEDLHITKDDVNFGSQLMSIGIVVAEIPANLILQRLGASVWLTSQMFLWGLVALTQTWCTNIHSFYATRFLLGLFEGGYIPGAQYMLSLFYTRKELAKRTAIFYFGNYLAAALGSLIAAGVLQMAGIRGLSGWQWLFLLEGVATLVIFLFFFALLPRSPIRTAPLHGRWDFFDDRERKILRARVLVEDESKGDEKAVWTFSMILRAMSNYRIWVHTILNLLALTPKGGLQLYGPTIIKQLGFSTVNANLLNAVSSFIVIFLSYLIAFCSDKTKLRGPWCIVAFTWSIAFAGALYGLPIGTEKWTRYAIFTLLSGGNALVQGLNDVWVNINATNSTNRSIGLALVVIGSNLGGIAGQQLFRSSDAPRYDHAFLAILLLYAMALLVTILLMWIYWRDNRNVVSEAVNEDGESTERRFDL